MIVFNCPKCGKEFKSKDENVGRKFSCSNCGENIRIPTLRELQQAPILQQVQTPSSLEANEQSLSDRLTASRLSDIDSDQDASQTSFHAAGDQDHARASFKRRSVSLSAIWTSAKRSVGRNLDDFLLRGQRRSESVESREKALAQGSYSPPLLMYLSYALGCIGLLAVFVSVVNFAEHLWVYRNPATDDDKIHQGVATFAHLIWIGSESLGTMTAFAVGKVLNYYGITAHYTRRACILFEDFTQTQMGGSHEEADNTP